MFLENAKSSITLAIDTFDRTSAFRILDECADLVDNVKFNYPLILKEGITLMSEVKYKYKKSIIADFKVADVPVTNNRILSIVRDNGGDAIMVHGFIGTDAILEMQAAAENKIGIILVTELTHPGGLEFTRQHAEDFAKLAVFLNCYGIQAPGTRPEQIKALRKIIGQEKVIVSCGVGAQGGDFIEAIDAGADFAIIGRAIYQSADPRKVVLELIDRKKKYIEEKNKTITA